MLPFTSEDANKLSWSNDFLDEAIAMRLLLNTYEKRPEAKPFWSEKDELRTVYLSCIQNVKKLQSELQSVYDIGTLGTSREATEQIFSTFQLIMKVLMPIIRVIYLVKGFPAIVTYITNIHVRNSFYGRYKFSLRYRNLFLKKSLGGTWKPHFGKYLFSLKLIKIIFVTMRTLISYPFSFFLDYQRELTD
jgi:hypothetical protein